MAKVSSAQATFGEAAGTPQTLLVSILSLGRPDNVLQQLASLPPWLAELALNRSMSCSIVVRNNDPSCDFVLVEERMREISACFPELSCCLYTGDANVGFGRGHNQNVLASPSRYCLFLNDDIGFPHMEWLAEAIDALDRDPLLACIGATENPQYINPTFGNGLFPTSGHVPSLKYAEASILLFNTSTFFRIGMFNDQLEWAMCEDADLSLRAQQLGYRIGWLPMPHQHWRSTSFNSLPMQVKSSILEANRATLFATWRSSFATGRVGRYEIFDLWTDGMGDAFCALPHLAAYLNGISEQHRDSVLVNLRHPELLRLCTDAPIRSVATKDVEDLREIVGTDGISTIRSIRDVNFSLPFNIHPLIASALGLPIASERSGEQFQSRLRDLKIQDSRLSGLEGRYCAFHAEFSRDHAGRALSPTCTLELLKVCTEIFDCVVLLGQEARVSAPGSVEDSGKVIDLQAQLSLSQLIAVVSNAEYFVGIDSFPAHIAGAAGVPSAVFFGAVHPLARVWDQSKLWPLTARLACTGCYHTHLEPSVPFCMRRDEACTSTITSEHVRAALSAMKNSAPHDWRTEWTRFSALQGRMLHVVQHHPAPPDRMFRPQSTGNEKISNLIYRVTDEISQLMRDRYEPSAVDALSNRNKELEAKIFSLRHELDEMRQSLRRATRTRGLDPLPTQILQVAQLPVQEIGCRIHCEGNWVTTEAIEEDSKILLPDLVGLGSRIHLRVDYQAEEGEFLQVYWAEAEQDFSESRTEVFPASGNGKHGDIFFELAAGEILRLRVDPRAKSGTSRFRMTIAGAFRIRSETATEKTVAPAPPPALVGRAQKRPGRAPRSNGVQH